MVENRKKHRQNRHPIIDCPTSEGVSKVSERASERSRAREGREQCKASSAKRAVRSKGTSEWPSTYIWVLGGSGPQCLGSDVNP